MDAGRKRALARRYGILAAGVALLVLDELLFAFEIGRTAWLILMPAGVLLVAGAWVALAALGRRSALAATAVVAACFFVVSAAVPGLRSASWWMLVRTHGNALERAVGILEPVRMERWTPSSRPLCTRLPGLDPEACPALREAMRDFGAHDAWKEGEVTVFVTYRWINTRSGLLHCPRECPPLAARPYPRYRRHVVGDWHRWAE